MPEIVQFIQEVKIYSALEASVYTFVFIVGLASLALVILYIIDRTQTKHASRRNYPVVGRLRYFFENLGEYFRQYFFAMDREELPFNRSQRSWVYKAAEGVDRTTAFGSTRDIRPAGPVFFVNCPYPTLEVDAAEPAPATIGPYARVPYITSSVFNISGMSFGAVAKPAVLALSNGAQMAVRLAWTKSFRCQRLSQPLNRRRD